MSLEPFHLCCPFTQRVICHCRQRQANKNKVTDTTKALNEFSDHVKTVYQLYTHVFEDYEKEFKLLNKKSLQESTIPQEDEFHPVFTRRYVTLPSTVLPQPQQEAQAQAQPVLSTPSTPKPGSSKEPADILARNPTVQHFYQLSKKAAQSSATPRNFKTATTLSGALPPFFTGQAAAVASAARNPALAGSWLQNLAAASGAPTSVPQQSPFNSLSFQSIAASLAAQAVAAQSNPGGAPMSAGTPLTPNSRLPPNLLAPGAQPFNMMHMLSGLLGSGASQSQGLPSTPTFFSPTPAFRQQAIPAALLTSTMSLPTKPNLQQAQNQQQNNNNNKPKRRGRPPKKKVCSECEKDSNPQDLLTCASCAYLVHTYCYDPNLSHLKPEHRVNWTCETCKRCERCGKAGQEENLLICEQCERGYHTFCLVPPLQTIPEGTWICSSCTSSGETPVAQTTTASLQHALQQHQKSLQQKRGREEPNNTTATAASSSEDSKRAPKRRRIDLKTNES